jgi:hypothetical protein
LRAIVVSGWVACFVAQFHSLGGVLVWFCYITAGHVEESNPETPIHDRQIEIAKKAGYLAITNAAMALPTPLPKAVAGCDTRRR